MNINEFNTLAEKTQLGDRGKLAARRVLVDGDSVADVARDMQLSRQAIYGYINAIKRARLERVSMRGNSYYITSKAANAVESKLQSIAKDRKT